MGNNDELKILIEAALDLEKSFQNMVLDMNKLRERMKSYQIKILAGLDRTASTAQIKNDLEQVAKNKNRIKVVGEVDRDATKKNIDAAIKKLEDTEVRITGVLDSSDIQKQLEQMPSMTAEADVNVDGVEQVDNLRQKMDRAGGSASNMAANLYLARTALQTLRRAASEAKETVVELDKAATDLALATGSGSEEAYVLLNEYNELAKQLKSTTTQVSDAAVEWLRQGKSAAETTALIEQSMVLSKVGAMSAEDATKNLTSAMKGYGMAVEDVSGIVDRLTAVDLKAAVSAGDLAVAMSRTASSANIAGIGMDKLLGYITVVEETTQKSAETIGESFKTIFARMGNVKLGQFLDDDGEDLSDVEKILNNFGIALRESNNQFRDFGAVLDEVAAKWENFSNVDQNAIATTIAGTRQRENFLVLMENYGKALEYAGVAADSAGTAIEKFSAYEDSIEAKTARFTAAIEGLTLDTVDSGFVGDLIDAGTAIVELVEKTDLLKAALVGLGAGAVLKSISAISGEFLAAKQNILNLGEAVQTLRRVQDTGALSAETITRLGGLTKGLTDEQLRLVLSTQQLTTAQMTQILTAGGLSEAETTAKLQTLGLATAEGTATAATFTLSGAMAGLGTAIKAAFASNPIGMIMLAAGAAYELVKGIMAIYDAVTVTAAEATEAMENSFSEFEEAETKVKSLNDELKTTQDRIGELNAKEALTFVEESELQKLKESVELLQIQADLAEKERIREAKEAADDTITAYRKNFKHDISADAVQEYMDYSNTSGNNAALFADESDISAMLAGIEQMKRLRDELDKSSENYQEDYQHFQGIIDDATDSIWEQISVLGTYKSNLEAIPYNELADDQKAALDEINAAIELVYKTLDPSKWNEIQWGNIVSDEKYSDDVKKLNELAAQSEITADTIKEQFPALAKACADAGIAVEDVIGNINASFESADGDGISTYTAQLSGLSDVISDLQSSYDLLEAAQKDMSDGDGLSPETIEKLAKAEENYLDYLYEENGVVKLNTEAWKENANAKMLGEMDEIQKEIDALEDQNDALAKTLDIYYQNKHMSAGNSVATEAWDEKIQELTSDIAENNEKIEENQAKLAIYSSLYGSITGDLDAYTAALQNFSNVANSIDSITGSFQTLANLQAEVANGFTMSLDKALEFAKVYPEILNSAQATADGQIMLNEGVVNSFIEGKKAELDAQIDAEVAKLEADKEVLQAKMEAAQAQLDLAKAVAEGEGDISKELAEYRINAGNAVAQALIDAGIDEATAFKLAAAAMAQNAEEFDRVAMEVCTDVNGNFNQAAYDLAQTMYQNLTNVKTDLASVATQAHETAKAIAGVGNGSVAGSSAVQGGSGGGTGSSGIKLNLTSGSFEGTEYTYTAKESGLEDFISQIELDISNYQNAISQIDGQIAALQALKNAPLKSFKGSGTGSSGSGSSGGTKDVEEYIASIDEYREAVERLRKAQEEADKLETAIDNAGSFEKKIELQEKLIAAYREEQAALHNLNDMRDSTITQGVESLRELGFAVQYNADTNELWIENLDHLNELTADSAGSYGSLQEATNALREGTEDLINTITDLNDANREGSGSWWELNRSIIETTISMYENMMQARKNAAMLAENGMENAIDTKNLADVKKFSAAMIAEYQDMQRILHQEAEYYRSLGYSDTSDEVSKLSDLWWDYADNIKSVKEQVVDYLIDIVDAASDSVDEIRSVSDTLYAAADEFAANDGFITIDTWNALRKVGTQYMQMLVDENGVYQINEERINAVIAARTRQLAVENAMSYVERLKLATQEGSIEDLNYLIFATTDATNSTWGLVYAELELMHTMGDLNDSQYQAALHNIQVMQDLAENAILSIGKVAGSVKDGLEKTKDGLQDLLDELEDMENGANDFIKYVMDMLKHRIQKQIELLEEMKKKYSEIIDLKKDSLDATKDEQDYQKTIAKKLKEMAKLQERINALALDDSRSAQAERAKLLEEMAELQEDLADSQADKSIEAQKEALDQMEEDYHAEKDKEIEILEDSTSSYQKLYDMAIDYIRNNWDTLYSELIAWNTEYGSVLNSEITEAWEAAQAAAQRYGDFVSAIMGGISAEIDSITKQIEAIDTQISNLGSDGSHINTTVGTAGNATSYSNEDAIHAAIREMYQNAQAWFTASEAEQDRLDKRNLVLGAQLNSLGVNARRDNGTWYDGNELLFEKYKRYIYHTGGFVGDEPLKPNERYIKAENGELVLTSDQQDSFVAQIDRIGAMTEKFMSAPLSMEQPILPDFSHLSNSTINNVTNSSSSQPVTINQGDVIIQGTVMGPKELAENINKYINMTEKMVDQYARLTGVKW